MSLISFDPIFTSVLQVKRLRQHSLINLPKMMQLERGISRIGPTTCDPQSLLTNHYLELLWFETAAVCKRQDAGREGQQQ